MNFFGENFKRGNIFFTMILVTSILGTSTYLYTTFQGVGNHKRLFGQDKGPSFKGKNYELAASLVTIITTSALALGILIGKANNDFMGGSRAFETIGLFILLLICFVVLSLAAVPTDDVSNNATEDNNLIYESISLSVVGISIGILTVMSRMTKEYTVLGTSLFVILSIVFLSLSVYIETIVDDNNVDVSDVKKFDRSVTQNEIDIIVVIFSLAAVVAASGVLHMILERKGFRKLMGRKASPRRSPGRKSSPKRKLGTLKPRK